MEANDRRPGKVPIVQTERNTITLSFVIGKYDGRTIELVLRCERDGAIYAAIASK